MIGRSLLFGATLLVAGCDGREASPPSPRSEAADQPAPPKPIPSQTKTPPPHDDAVTSRDPGYVVMSWARAMSTRDWETAYGFWNEGGARSGMSLDQFRARWSKVENPQFDIGAGTTEGAAGSLYYTAPLTLTDGPRRVRGKIVLRRANDVPGATAEQLRWHIERLDLQP